MIRRSLVPFSLIGLLFVAWLGSLHLAYRPDAAELARPEGSARVDGLMTRQRQLWLSNGGDAEIDVMRRNNPEWDFMARTFTVLSAASLAIDRPDEAPELLALIDVVLDDTLTRESEEGPEYFLMAYAHRGPFVGTEGGRIESLFVDGEIAAMLAARLLVAEDERYDAALRAREARIRRAMEAGPVLSAESYPDECWTFCNTFALSALMMADAAHGSREHRDFAERWLAMARERLVDDTTGMLVSSYMWDGRHLDGPEGSSIFMSAHNLRLVDETFARDQYERGRDALGDELFGFGWAREWPKTWESGADVDSGPIVPLVEASAGASGLMILGAASFDDRDTLASLLTTLDFAAFPTDDGGSLRYAAGNGVGDAALLYALSSGPLFDRVLGRR